MKITVTVNNEEAMLFKDPIIKMAKKRGERIKSVEPIILSNANMAIEYIKKVVKRRWPKAEKVFANDLRFIDNYVSIFRCRIKAFEPAIIKDADAAYDYACHVIKGRWPEAEPHIMKDPQKAHWYACHVIGGRWPEAEPTIMEDPRSAYRYADDVIKGRWPEAEPHIMQDPEKAYLYAKFTIKGRWPEAEPIIMKDPKCACWYACEIINGRWFAAEPIILEGGLASYYMEELQKHCLKSDKAYKHRGRTLRNERALRNYLISTNPIFKTHMPDSTPLRQDQLLEV